MDRNLTRLVKETPVVMLADVLSSAGAGRIALKRFVAISPKGPYFILGGPVAGQAVGGLLMGMEMSFCIFYISPPIVVCRKTMHSVSKIIASILMIPSSTCHA